jgi:hypothetical protein
MIEDFLLGFWRSRAGKASWRRLGGKSFELTRGRCGDEETAKAIDAEQPVTPDAGLRHGLNSSNKRQIQKVQTICEHLKMSTERKEESRIVLNKIQPLWRTVVANATHNNGGTDSSSVHETCNLQNLKRSSYSKRASASYGRSAMNPNLPMRTGRQRHWAFHYIASLANQSRPIPSNAPLALPFSLLKRGPGHLLFEVREIASLGIFS